MKEEEPASINKKLLFTLLFLIFVIFGFIITLIFINNKSVETSDSISTDDEITKITKQYQDIIDSSANQEEQANAYIDRAYDLSRYVLEGDTSHCNQIKTDLETAKSLSSNEDLQIIAESILATCEPIKTEPTQIKTGGTNE